MDLWQKLTIDWPCRLGDWLWTNIAVPLSALPGQITFRRVVFLAALLVATIALAQLFSLDMAFLMAGDIAFYCEIASAVMLIIVRGRIRHAVDMAKPVLIHAAGQVIGRLRTARHHRGGRRPAVRDAGSDEGDDVDRSCPQRIWAMT